MADEPIIFLVVEDVLELHAAGLEKYGGAAGIRDRHALESAVMQPQASFGGEFLYEDVFAMAAAYAFHIAEAQAFLDGNKRTAVLAAIIFLDLNDFRILNQDDILYMAMIEIADRTMTKAQLANMLRDLAGV
jgi:death-on-curing protein